MFEGTIWLWIGFNLFVLSMLALDLGVFHRHAHKVSIKEATIWSLVWIALAMIFNLGLYLFWDKVSPASDYSNSEAALAFFTGYLIEKSLSVDNIFVFVLIFTFFGVPAIYQHRVLFWGILGALIIDCRRRSALEGIPLDHLHIWSIPDLYRYPDGDSSQ